jgi:hypothetical protein
VALKAHVVSHRTSLNMATSVQSPSSSERWISMDFEGGVTSFMEREAEAMLPVFGNCGLLALRTVFFLHLDTT